LKPRRLAVTDWLPPGNTWEIRLDALGDDLAAQQTTSNSQSLNSAETG